MECSICSHGSYIPAPSFPISRSYWTFPIYSLLCSRLGAFAHNCSPWNVSACVNPLHSSLIHLENRDQIFLIGRICSMPTLICPRYSWTERLEKTKNKSLERYFLELKISHWVKQSHFLWCNWTWPLFTPRRSCLSLSGTHLPNGCQTFLSQWETDKGTQTLEGNLICSQQSSFESKPLSLDTLLLRPGEGWLLCSSGNPGVADPSR